ncbi:MAG TPA: polyprenol phosphomannose-dependent alpha 1,6 mannosyltransferase MptB [Frankiaceae bacterium]|nr:polyprenol phosphomannose-dependent alpha 1,6 mannosyltransferase MptB [Frankiaceae bacterium]
MTPSPDRAGRSGRAALALVASSAGLVALTAFLGPSAATRAPGTQSALPPYHLDTRPSAWLVTALLVAATVGGAVGLLLALRALDRGWAPDPRRLLAGGLVAAVALLLVPPTSSDDLYSYTAYGRMAATGTDPYTTTPNDLPGDPVVDQAGEPWRDVASVYGPLATAEQALAMEIAGDDVRTGAALLALASAAAFGLTGVLLHRAARDDAARRRTAVLWTLNPLLLMHLVAGAHVDALLVALAVAAVLALRRSPFIAGVLGGAAVCVKASGVLAAAALAWTERRAPRRLALLAAGAISVTPPLYVAFGGWTALGPVRRASRFVSFGSPWRALSVPLDSLAGSATSRAVVSALSLLAVAALCVLLARALPGLGTAHGGAPRTAAVTALAWLTGATYVLPWYDAWAWPFLALLPASRWDRWLAVRTAVLTVAYLPGRTVPLPPVLADLLSGFRLYVTPVALGLLAVVAVRWSLRAEHRESA